MYKYIYSSRAASWRIAQSIQGQSKVDNIIRVRRLATEAGTKSSGGVFTGLFQRITSFIIGAGLTALVSQYYLYEEIKKSNADMLEKQKDIEKRLATLEKK